MHQHVRGRGFSTAAVTAAAVERVEHGRLGAEEPQPVALVCVPGGADHGVPGRDQLRDEPAADGAGRTGEEDAHDCSVPSWLSHRRRDGRGGRDRWLERVMVDTWAPEKLRGYAFSIAYRMLGSVGEAEDVVQEAMIRLHAADRDRGPLARPRTRPR